MTALQDLPVHDLLRKEADDFDRLLLNRLDRLEGVPTRLAESMRYSIAAGGKRLRPALVIWSCDACGGNKMDAMTAAMAIECVHTFSLIHDDLPAIDNDDLRRGQPTNHREFGEATAILAGDALLAFAFEVIAADVRQPDTARQMILELSRATGAAGMIGGELDDIEGERSVLAAATVGRIHVAKTARLIQCACRLGAIAANAGDTEYEALSEYGMQLGLAFQIADDLLDETGTEHEVGKRISKDSAANKQTFPRVIGVDASRRLALETAQKAELQAERLGSKASRLAALTRYVVERNS